MFTSRQTNLDSTRDRNWPIIYKLRSPNRPSDCLTGFTGLRQECVCSNSQCECIADSIVLSAKLFMYWNGSSMRININKIVVVSNIIDLYGNHLQWQIRSTVSLITLLLFIQHRYQTAHLNDDHQLVVCDWAPLRPPCTHYETFWGRGSNSGLVWCYSELCYYRKTSVEFFLHFYRNVIYQRCLTGNLTFRICIHDVGPLVSIYIKRVINENVDANYFIYRWF